MASGLQSPRLGEMSGVMVPGEKICCALPTQYSSRSLRSAQSPPLWGGSPVSIIPIFHSSMRKRKF